MTLGLINANPVVHAKKERVARTEDLPHSDVDAVDPLDIYDILFHFISFKLRQSVLFTLIPKPVELSQSF